MKNLFLVCAALTLLATGCGEEVVVQNAPVGHSTVDVAEVDKDALASALAANELTLVDFTATW